MNRAMKEKIIARMSQLRDDIRERLATTGKVASGHTNRSLIVVDDGMTITLYGRPFFPSVQYGSSLWNGHTGVSCSFEAFRQFIANWVQAKGLNFGQHQAHERAVSAITASIIKYGTRDWREHRYTDIYDTLIAQCWQDLQDEAIGVAGEAVDVAISKWQRF